VTRRRKLEKLVDWDIQLAYALKFSSQNKHL
jgi:hypothetical protein